MRLSLSSNARRRTLRRGLTVFVLTCIAAAASAAAPRPWLDVSASFEQRAASTHERIGYMESLQIMRAIKGVFQRASHKLGEQ